MGEQLTIELSDSMIEAVAQRAVELLRTEPERRYLSKSATAEFFGISERQLKGMRERGCPAHKVGRSLFFDVEELGRWIGRQPSR